MTEDAEYAGWRFWRSVPEARHGIEIERFVAVGAGTSRRFKTASPGHCSVFLERRNPSKAVKVDDELARADAGGGGGGSGGNNDGANVATSDWRRTSRPNRVGRLLCDASPTGDAPSAGPEDERPLGGVLPVPSMGNKSSSHHADKRAKGSLDALSETPKGSPGLFRLGRDAKGKGVKRTPQPVRKTVDDASAAVTVKATDTPERRPESSPESSISGSVYVDSVSHLPTPAEDDARDAEHPTDDVVALQDSPSNTSDNTVFGDDDDDFLGSCLDAVASQAGQTVPATSHRTPVRVRSFSEAETTSHFATPSCTSLGRGDFASRPIPNSDGTLHMGAAASTPTFTLTQHRKVVRTLARVG